MTSLKHWDEVINVVNLIIIYVKKEIIRREERRNGEGRKKNKTKQKQKQEESPESGSQIWVSAKPYILLTCSLENQEL